jgi:hypothetical protein
VTPLLTIGVETGSIERVPADVAVVTVFETERPLRGECGRADWRLCGLLSDLLREGRFSGRPGEAALVPTFGRLRAPRLLLLGLGPQPGFGALEVKAAAREAVARLLRLRAASAALALPGQWTGLLPPGPSAGAVLRGAAAALSPGEPALRLDLIVAEGAASKALAGLETAWRALPEGGLLVRVRGPHAGGGAAHRGMGPPATAAEEPISSLSQRV